MSDQKTMKHLWKHMWSSTAEEKSEAESKLANIERNILTSLEELYKVAGTDVPSTITSLKNDDNKKG